MFGLYYNLQVSTLAISIRLKFPIMSSEGEATMTDDGKKTLEVSILYFTCLNGQGLSTGKIGMGVNSRRFQGFMCRAVP